MEDATNQKSNEIETNPSSLLIPDTLPIDELRHGIAFESRETTTCPTVEFQTIFGTGPLAKIAGCACEPEHTTPTTLIEGDLHLHVQASLRSYIRKTVSGAQAASCWTPPQLGMPETPQVLKMDLGQPRDINSINVRVLQKPFQHVHQDSPGPARATRLPTITLYIRLLVRDQRLPGSFCSIRIYHDPVALPRTAQAVGLLTICFKLKDFAFS